MNYEYIEQLATFLRYWALRMSTKAGSGHPSSGLSAADLMATLWTTTFRFDFKNPDNPNNDRLIFSKGHATPLYYGLFAAAGAIKPEELKFPSPSQSWQLSQMVYLSLFEALNL